MKELEALELLFEQEIEFAFDKTAMPRKLPPKLAQRLLEKGDILRDQITLGHDAFGPIAVPCFYLTHQGRFRYCESRKEEPDD